MLLPKALLSDYASSRFIRILLVFFAQKCVVPFVVWRLRRELQQVTSEVARANN